MRVLFCTDGSKISFHSIENFSVWMKDFTVDILCAIDWSFLPDTVAVEDSEFAVQCTNSADSILDYSQRFLIEKGIKIDEKIKMCGPTVDCILETCEKKEYEFIVLGSHGKKGIQKWLGSVSQEVAAVARISTYISKERNDSKKVLFTIDSSEINSNVIKKCLDLFDFTDKEVYLTTVYEVPDYLFLEGNINSNWMLDIEKKQETAAMLLLNKYEKMFNEKGVNVSHKDILSGTPSQEIIKYTSREGIDLVVCGIRERNKLSKFLLSSVSKRVLENVKADVLIVR